jgi:hypothetical protein
MHSVLFLPSPLRQWRLFFCSIIACTERTCHRPGISWAHLLNTSIQQTSVATTAEEVSNNSFDGVERIPQDRSPSKAVLRAEEWTPMTKSLRSTLMLLADVRVVTVEWRGECKRFALVVRGPLGSMCVLVGPSVSVTHVFTCPFRHKLLACVLTAQMPVAECLQTGQLSERACAGLTPHTNVAS